MSQIGVVLCLVVDCHFISFPIIVYYCNETAKYDVGKRKWTSSGACCVFAKVYCKKDGTSISDGVRDKIVSPISLVDYMFCFLCVICL